MQFQLGARRGGVARSTMSVGDEYGFALGSAVSSSAGIVVVQGENV